MIERLETIETPIGPVSLRAAISDRDHGYITFDTMLTECFPELMPGMAVLSSVILRCLVHADTDIEAVTISIQIDDEAKSAQSIPESGEFLLSRIYGQGDLLLTFATRDGDWLAHCARGGKLVPQRFKDEVDTFHMLPWVEFTSGGLSVSIPPLYAGESVTLFFAASWGNKMQTDPDEYATTLAADLSMPNTGF